MSSMVAWRWPHARADGGPGGTVTSATVAVGGSEAVGRFIIHTAHNLPWTQGRPLFRALMKWMPLKLKSRVEEIFKGKIT